MTTPVIRSARPDDHAAYVRLSAELQVPDPPAQLDEWSGMLVPRAFVAEADGAVIGYSCWSRTVSPFHVSQLVVDPAWRGRRVGEELLRALADIARSQGIAAWSLNVKVENTSAIRLYERLGFRITGRGDALHVPRAVLARLPSCGVTAEPVTDAASAETALGLAPASLTRRLTTTPEGGAVLVREESGNIAGVAVFSRVRGGAGLFRISRPDAAGPLIAAVLHGLGGRDFMHLWVDDNEALADLLLGAGATVNFRAFQMRGPVPMAPPAAA